LSLSNSKEQTRVAIVFGLIAIIIALRLYEPDVATPAGSLISRILLIYWSLYAIFTVYGISQTRNVKLSNRLRYFGDLFFQFALYFVVIGVIAVILMEKFGILVVSEWDYLTAWLFSIIGFLAPETLGFMKALWNWRQFPNRVKSDWRKVARTWGLFLLMSLPLLVLHFYKWIF
jgi:hypothetical protein